ncbi:MAG: M23 family metallopeptidase [Saprospiraceae bacterium]
MSKILFPLFLIVFAVWYINFDPVAYRAQQEQESAASTTNSSENTTTITEKNLSRSFLFPLKNKDLTDIISGYGDQRGGGKRQHEGIDIPAPKGTPVIAISKGTISKVANKGNGGKQVWLKSNDGKHTFFYAHLNSFTVAEGQLIKRGEQIGTVGNTGNARHTLPHLHLGVYVGSRQTIDPALIFESSKK